APYAARVREVLEAGDLRVVDLVERSQLDDGHHLVLEEDRQDRDVDRRGLAEARRDRDVVLGRARDDDRLALERRLADQALARLERVGESLAALVAVARDQPEQ